MFKSEKTEKGNIGYSAISQELADKQAAIMDTNNCYNCRNCDNCDNCRDCRDCRDCRYCADCDNCDNCRYCADCDNCADCRNCANCRYCRNCDNCRNCANCVNCPRWMVCSNPISKNIYTFSGTPFTVSTDGENIQIGCKNFSAKLWEKIRETGNFNDYGISRDEFKRMIPYAELILSLVQKRKEMEE